MAARATPHWRRTAARVEYGVRASRGVTPVPSRCAAVAAAAQRTPRSETRKLRSVAVQQTAIAAIHQRDGVLHQAHGLRAP
jgi:hypothetical protein